MTKEANETKKTNCEKQRMVATIENHLSSNVSAMESACNISMASCIAFKLRCKNTKHYVRTFIFSNSLDYVCFQ